MQSVNGIPLLGYGTYPLLARMRAATVLADKADFAGAVAEFDKVADDNSTPQALRYMARALDADVRKSDDIDLVRLKRPRAA